VLAMNFHKAFIEQKEKNAHRLNHDHVDCLQNEEKAFLRRNLFELHSGRSESNRLL
jgi:hypothetical protein